VIMVGRWVAFFIVEELQLAVQWRRHKKPKRKILNLKFRREIF
jgi:hypothetical protein